MTVDVCESINYPPPSPPQGGEQQSAHEAHAQYMQAWGPSKMEWLRVKLQSLENEKREWTIAEYQWYLEEYKRRLPSTITKQIGLIEWMRDDDTVPVVMDGSLRQLVETFWVHIKYREKVLNQPATTLGNYHTAIRGLGDYLGIPDNVWPTKPAVPRKAPVMLPSPENIYDLIHHQYFPSWRDPRGPILKGLLVYDFLVGIRAPSEMHTLKIYDLDTANHTIVITEPKKGGAERRMLIEPQWLCCSNNMPSLGAHVTHRAKLPGYEEQDGFFLKQNGTPFASKDAIRTWLNKHVKPVFPWFHPYLGRHWCATARLIEWDFDHTRVADWLGHTTVEELRKTYDRSARVAHARHGGDWLRRAARRSGINRTERRRVGKRREMGSLSQITPVSEMRARGDSPCPTEGIWFSGIVILALLTQAHSPKSSDSEVAVFIVQASGRLSHRPEKPISIPRRAAPTHSPMIAST